MDGAGDEASGVGATEGVGAAVAGAGEGEVVEGAGEGVGGAFVGGGVGAAAGETLGAGAGDCARQEVVKRAKSRKSLKLIFSNSLFLSF